MSAIGAEQFERICAGVWRDRAAILFRRGAFNDEDTLIEAVYWRLCKAGGKPERRLDDYAPLLQKLIEQYRNERETKGKGC